MSDDAPRRLLLIGGGHSHIEVLRRFARKPEPRIAVTLVSPDPLTAYSGMLPGMVAGHYTAGEAHIALGPLARWAQADFLADRVRALDPVARTATLSSGATLAYDFASIDIGSTPRLEAPGAREHALAVKPVGLFLAAWERILADAQIGRIAALVVVGGGTGGVELLLAMQYRLRRLLGPRAPAFALVTDRLALPPAAQAQLVGLLQQRGVALHVGSAVAQMVKGAIALQTGEVIRAEHAIWTTGAAAAPWLAASGLACDERGFVRVGAHLQSLSHPSIFAAGDCASQEGHPRPRAGVFAVRQGPVLAANLRRGALGAPLADYVPQRHALALISTGGKYAIAVRGTVAVAGRWVWHWKDRIDRRFVARYRPLP
jgi:selenide, water dikinase